MEKQRCAALNSEPDFLAPYLVNFPCSKPNPTQSMEIYEKCLQSIELEYADVLNDLRRTFNEVIATNNCNNFLSSHRILMLVCISFNSTKSKRKI